MDQVRDLSQFKLGTSRAGEGKESVEDNECSEPAQVKVSAAVRKNRVQTVEKKAESQFGYLRLYVNGYCLRISECIGCDPTPPGIYIAPNSHDLIPILLGYHGHKFVPKLLLVERKELRLAGAQDLLYTINDEPDFFRLLAAHENENAIERILFSEMK
ncbi:hypothetical protein TNCV_3911491 [Trichonephila clavipes]|nr:hypothetical protein TNCV_3911491 [Trichonephila clavipes]